MREKLIELMDEYLYPSSVEGMADHLIANGVTIQKWIPVTERLPEEWKDVLVLLRFGCCETAVYLGVPGKWRVTWYRDMIGVDSVTHWMPLPEPPNGERRTDDERTG